jgi:hypothetical protein
LAGGGGAIDDMADALLPPPQVLLMLVMVLTQALGGSVLGCRLLGAWNDDMVSASYAYIHSSWHASTQ